MNIGDKVRFLNDVGGGKVTAFRPGGIVLIEDEDGFEVPMSQHEVVVIEDKPEVEKKTASKAKKSMPPQVEKETASRTVNGKEYLQSKAAVPAEKEEVDEQLEARVVRLEQALQSQTQTLQAQAQVIEQIKEALQKAEAQINLLEAENNLRKNERMMASKTKPKAKPKVEKTITIENLHIL